MSLTCPKCGGSVMDDPIDVDMVLCTSCNKEFFVTHAFGRTFFSRLERMGTHGLPTHPAC